MADAIQATQDASAETQEILKELEGEGNEIAGQPKPADPVEEQEKQEQKDESAKPEESEKKPEKIEREQKYVPVSKHNEERHKRQEAERLAEEARKEAAELRAKLADKPSEKSNDLKSAAQALADKHGLDQEFISELLETTTKINSRNDLSEEAKADLAIIKQAKAEAEAKLKETAQETGFSNEFANVIKEFPELAERKDELKQLAFSEGNVNTSLRRLALEYLHDNPVKPGRRSSESPTQGKGKSDVIDFENITEDDFKNLSREELDLYETWLTKRKR